MQDIAGQVHLEFGQRVRLKLQAFPNLGRLKGS